jgi:uncharacterized protein (TIGR00251 family)
MEYRIKVIANSKKEGVTELSDGRLEVRVDAPRKEGRANERVCEIVADYLHVSADSVAITKGHDRSSKVIRIKTPHNSQ